MILIYDLVHQRKLLAFRQCFYFEITLLISLSGIVHAFKPSIALMSIIRMKTQCA